MEQLRYNQICEGPLRPEGEFVLYWMRTARRTRDNPALCRAAALARELQRPLVVLETYPLDSQYDTPRFVAFAGAGMRDNETALRRSGARYQSFIERTPGTEEALLRNASASACLLVTDLHPGHPLPAFAAALGVRVEAIDANGLVPLRAFDRTAVRAYDFRRWVHEYLGEHPDELLAEPSIPTDLPSISPQLQRRVDAWVDEPPDSGQLEPGSATPPGGSASARRVLDGWLTRVDSYERARHPDEGGGSGLSPYLRWGHISAREILQAVLAKSSDTQDLAPEAAPWTASPGAMAFLDQLVTWRELAYHFAFRVPNHDHYETLPPWALETLAAHANDPRPTIYELEQLERAETADPLWNAAQNELVERGAIQGYVRMVWGKRLLEWSKTPQEAFERAVYLNDKWALDGRDPTSYAGIGWVFGRFDRPWGPRRPIFGTVRYMSSAATMRKLRLRNYLEKYSGART